MRNAKEELLEELKHTPSTIKCAKITIGDEDDRKFINLNVGYNENDWKGFLELLDFTIYDGGFGGQELFGNVWFEDGTWLERGEYDGSEWWEHKVCPPIPKELT